MVFCYDSLSSICATISLSLLFLSSSEVSYELPKITHDFRSQLLNYFKYDCNAIEIYLHVQQSACQIVCFTAFLTSLILQ